ncbi:MAG: asparagine synthase-related protein [Candidatus Omnitrophota bacterium]
MGRICGFINSNSVSANIANMLSNCYPAGEKSDFSGLYYVDRDTFLAVEGKGNLARSMDGRFACLIDGKIFNLKELSADFMDKKSHGNADSQAAAILSFYMQQGTAAFSRLKGSFALVIWDSREQQLILARDPFGIKCVYYANTRGVLSFSSSLTGLVRMPWFNKEIGMSGFLEYLSCGYVSSPSTIYKNAASLNAGEYLVFKDNDARIENYRPVEPHKWYFHDTGDIGERELVDRFERLLFNAISCRLSKTQKTAVYLSGGMDTSLLCAMLRNYTDGDIVAFTSGSNNPICDETHHAQAVAKHLNIECRSYYPTREDFFSALELLPDIYGQPFADISAIPTYLITRKVAEEFRMVFTGEGPDFMFGNYDFRSLYYYYKVVPPGLRGQVSRLVGYIIQRFYKARISPNLDVPELMRQRDFFWVFLRMFKSADLENLVRESIYNESFWVYRFLEKRKDIPLAERLRLAQYICYGINNVLYKSEQAHSASLVELVCPYYDAELFNFVQFLPTKYKFRRFFGKYLQKKLLYKYVPKKMLDRPKRGFVVDFAEFGMAPLRALTDKYLSKKRLDETGIINTSFALQCVEDYYRGDTSMGPKLWTLLVFGMWCDRFQ